MVIGAPNGWAQGTIIINPNPAVPPTNDLFANPIIVSGTTASVHGTTVGAGYEPGEPAHGGFSAHYSVWFQWTAPANGMAEISAQASSFPGRVAVYTGSALTNLVAVSLLPQSSLFHPRFSVVPGQTYMIAVDNGITATTAGSFQGPPTPFTLNLSVATIALSRPALTASLPGDEPVELEFTNLDGNAAVVWLEGFAGTNSLGVVTNEPFRFGYTASKLPDAVTIRAAGTNALGQRVASLPTELTFSPSNDLFMSATVITNDSTFLSFSSDVRFATAEPGEPNHSTNVTANRSAWWTWTPRYGGPTEIVLDTRNSRLAVYKGSQLDSLERVANIQTAQSTSVLVVVTWPPVSYTVRTSFRTDPGVTYYFALESTALPVSWAIRQHTFELSAAGPQRATVGLNASLEALYGETDRPLVEVEFVLGEPGSSYSFFGGPTVREIRSLARVSGLPYRLDWTPGMPGTFYIWARGTNVLGQRRETSPVHFTVLPSNDRFGNRTLIEPGTLTTNFIFTLAGTSTQPGEPPHTAGPAAHTRWWRWTPSYSGEVRFKAVRGQLGLPLEIYTGGSLATLRLVANNHGTTYIPGRSGLIRLNVKAGVTYFIRVDDTHPEYGNASQPGTLTLEPATTPLPGSLDLSFVTVRTNAQGFLEQTALARVYMPDGVTPVTQARFRAQLYVGRSLAELEPVGVPRSFYSGEILKRKPNLAGAVAGGAVLVPGMTPGENVLVQIRVWDASAGATYESARAKGGLFGRSQLLTVKVGSEAGGPGELLGLRDFRLRNGDASFTPGTWSSSSSAATGKAPAWRLTAPSGFRYEIETKSVDSDWQPLLVVTNSGGSITFVDPRADQPGMSWYRSRLLD